MTLLSVRELVNRHPHIFALGADVRKHLILEMYCDHHMLSTLRTCEAKFYEEQLAHVGTKTSRYFSLEFGIWLHEALDKYYTGWKKFGQPPVLDEWVDWALKLWNEMRMDDFAPAPATLTKEMRGDTKKYYDFCKWDTKGAITRLLIQYYAFYMNQRMRVVDTEISFGRAGEVPLGGINDFCDEPPIRCFLTGRIDLLVDNGTKIGPVDHKSTARFDGYESNDFDPHEGITGYIFAVNSILKNHAEPEGIGATTPIRVPQVCNSGWIHHISLADSEPRFKPTLITKTNQQLEEYRMRQLRACKRVYELASSSAKLENYGAVEFATDKCNNIYNSPCPFRELHRQPFIQREGTIAQFYEIKPAWNPAAKKEEKK
jgi:hypothetical protein